MHVHMHVRVAHILVLGITFSGSGDTVDERREGPLHWAAALAQLPGTTTSQI